VFYRNLKEKARHTDIFPILVKFTVVYMMMMMMINEDCTFISNSYAVSNVQENSDL